METVADFIFGGSKITADGDCSRKIKRCLLLWRKAMRNLDDILKLPTKVCIVKAITFPGVTYGYESWTIKKAEHQIIDAFKLWWWRRLLRVPWTARRSNPVNPKENQPWTFTGRTEAEAKAPVLWLCDVKSQLIRKAPDAGRLRAGREGDNRRWDAWMASPTQWTWVWANSRR